MNQVKLSTEALIYCAGYFDGEGSISFSHYKKTGGFGLRMAIESADLESLQFFAETFSTEVRFVKKPLKRQQKRQTWRVLLTGKRAQEALGLLQPYIRTKRIIVEAVLKVKFGEVGGGRVRDKIGVEERAYREKVVELVTTYNNRTTLLENPLKETGSAVH